MLEVLEQDRREARRYLSSEASATSCDAFALRQLRARERLTRLVAFYHRHSCRMARIHVLASSSVTLGRFCGFSNAFDSIGEAVMPVDQASEPRSDAWDRYAQACRDRWPMDTRDELWLEAHGEDWAELHERRLDEAFDVEAAANEGHPAWTLLRQHIDVTLGSRRLDRGALRGEIAYETAIAHSMALAVLSLFTRALSLLVLPPSPPAPKGQQSMRRRSSCAQLHTTLEHPQIEDRLWEPNQQRKRHLRQG